jgi:hypothetical protein
LPLVTDLAALLQREVVVDEQHFCRRTRQRFQHPPGRHLLVDDHHIVGRVGTARDLLCLAQHHQVVAFRIKDFQLNVEGLCCDSHEPRYQLPLLPRATFDGFSGVKEHHTRRLPGCKRGVRRA